MRKIEILMNQAITNRIDWKLDNTEVTYSPERDASYVMLHGNHIATIGEDFIELYNCGWYTNTTKSRLNAILRDHGCSNEGVFQKKGEWFVSDKVKTVPFSEGMVLR